MSEKVKNEDKIQRQKLWLETEKKITLGFSVEDLRTSGLLSVERRNWRAALLRLTEAVRWGVRDLQTLDALGEAAYQTKTPQALLAFQNEYTESMVAVHMARAFLMMGQLQECRKYLAISNDTLLKEAIAKVISVEKDIQTAIEVMTSPLIHANENLNLIEYWQLLSPVAEVAANHQLVQQAERKLKAYAYDRPVVHFNQALRLLACGELSAGWKLYDWRLAPGSPCAQPMACADISVWEGEDLKGKELLILLENGFGDQIFSLRYCQALLNDGIHLSIATSPELFELVKASFPKNSVHLMKDAHQIDYWNSKNKPDYWIYAFSVPARSKHFSYVCTEGYLQAHANSVAEVKLEITKINSEFLPVRAITWHGDIATAPMRTRAYSVTDFLEQSEVLKSPCVLINLQKDVTAAELSILKKAATDNKCILLDPSQRLNDFATTAAWLTNCDQIYSCDTAVAHLAGALSLHLTVLVRNKAIWHWIASEAGAGQYKSNWYSSANVKYALTPKFSYMFDIRLSETV